MRTAVPETRCRLPLAPPRAERLVRRRRSPEWNAWGRLPGGRVDGWTATHGVAYRGAASTGGLQLLDAPSAGYERNAYRRTGRPRSVSGACRSTPRMLRTAIARRRRRTVGIRRTILDVRRRCGGGGGRGARGCLVDDRTRRRGTEDGARFRGGRSRTFGPDLVVDDLGKWRAVPGELLYHKGHEPLAGACQPFHAERSGDPAQGTGDLEVAGGLHGRDALRESPRGASDLVGEGVWNRGPSPVGVGNAVREAVESTPRGERRGRRRREDEALALVVPLGEHVDRDRVACGVVRHVGRAHSGELLTPQGQVEEQTDDHGVAQRPPRVGLPLRRVEERADALDARAARVPVGRDPRRADIPSGPVDLPDDAREAGQGPKRRERRVDGGGRARASRRVSRLASPGTEGVVRTLCSQSASYRDKIAVTDGFDGP